MICSNAFKILLIFFNLPFFPIGGVALNQASGNLTEYEFAMNGTINGKNMDESEALAEGVLRYYDCNYTKRADLGLNQCEYGSGNDKQVL